MKTIIVGAGETGYYIASEFTDDNYEVTIVDTDQDKLQILQRQLNVATVQGSGTDLETLEKAGIAQTDLMIACTNHDETNLISCMLANNYSVKQKVALTRTRSYVRKDLIDKYNRFGIDMMINTSSVVAHEVSAVVDMAIASEVSSFADDQVLLVGLKIKAETPFANTALKDIPRQDFPFLIACIVRDGQSIIPGGNFTILVDDILYLLLPKTATGDLHEFLKVKLTRNRKAVVAGESPIAIEIADQLLKNRFEVTLVSNDLTAVHSVEEQFATEKEFKAVHGEVDQIRLQLQLDVPTSSLFIAANKDDLYNLTTGMAAKHLGVSKVIALINRQDLIDAAQNAGVDVQIASRRSTARRLKKLLRAGHNSLEYATIGDTDMEVLEMEASSESSILEVPLKDIKFPENSLAAVIISGGEVVIPSGLTQIQEGDKVIMVTLPKNVDLLEEMIEGKVRESVLDEQ